MNTKMSDSDRQIWDLRKNARCDTREYTIGDLIKKIDKGYVKFHKRNSYSIHQDDFDYFFRKRSQFVEWVLLGLPSVPIYVKYGDIMEIIDYSNRFHSLYCFANDEFNLDNLELLTTLNNVSFDKMGDYWQERFLDTKLRITLLSDDVNDNIIEYIYRNCSNFPD